MKRIATLLIPALTLAAACTQAPTSASAASGSARHDGGTAAAPAPTDTTGRGILVGGGH